MTDTKLSLEELEHHVLAAALQQTDILEKVVADFSDRINGRLGSLLKAAEVYFTVTRGLLDKQGLTAILARSEPDPTKHQDYLALFDELTGPQHANVPHEKARWYLHEYDEAWQIKTTGEALSAAAAALRHGADHNGTHLTGSQAAWHTLAQLKLEFDTRASPTAMSSVEIGEALEAAEREFEDAKLGKNLGPPFKIPDLTAAIGGHRPGSFHIYAAFAHEGKSFLLINDAHDIYIKGGNIGFASGEMTQQEVRARIYGLHSTLPQFGQPLPTKKIENGTLDEEEQKIFKAVLKDLKENPNYGKIFIFQFPYNSTPSTVFNRFNLFDQIVPLDVVFLDYVGLLVSDARRVSRREELDDILRHSRALALDFGKGRSVATVTAYQTNRESYRQALNDGYYTLTCLAECAQAEQSATSVAWALNLPQNQDQIKAGVIKNRYGELIRELYIAKNFRHAELRSMQTGRATEKKATKSVLDI